MSMLKLIQSGAQQFDEPVAQLIKISSRGLLGHDRQQFVKRAGAEFAHQLSLIKFAAGEIPIHLLAMGAHEKYGANRNADGFKQAMLEACHPTFVSHARFYRDHANRDPAKSYGVVKLSAYHRPMARVELICALNGTAEAAAQNGGLLADRELTKLANEEDIPVSMAIRVPYDVCSGCQNRARTRDEYCDSIENGGHCKAGGLKHNLGRLLSDGHVLHADNPTGTFFDISHVWRPADRIAYVMGQLKAASADRIVSGAERAELAELTAPASVLIGADVLPLTAQQLKLAHRLVDLERAWRPSNDALAFVSSVQPCLASPPHGHHKFAQVMRALVDARIVLPVREFLTLTADMTDKQAADTAPAIQARLPGIYSRLLTAPNIEARLQDNPYLPGAAASAEIRMWAAKQAAAFSLAEPYLTQRVRLAAIRQVQADLVPVRSLEKQATVATPYERLAEHYAMYKLAFLHAVQETDELARLAVLQNFVL